MAVRNCWVVDTVPSLHKAGALPDSRSPMIAVGGAVMSQPCSSMFRDGWSIVLSDENFTNSCIRRPDGNDCRPFGLSVHYRTPSPPASDEKRPQHPPCWGRFFGAGLL